MTDEMKKKIGERIKAARKAKGLSQEALGEKLEVSFQAVSSWETGKFIPDAEHLPQLSAVLDLSLDSLFAEGDREWQLKPVNYNFSHMFTFVKGRAQMLNMPQTLAVLDILRSAHGAQERRSRYGVETTYMVHPLTMACHALAMRLAEDDVIAGDVIVSVTLGGGDSSSFSLEKGEYVMQITAIGNTNGKVTVNIQ